MLGKLVDTLLILERYMHIIVLRKEHPERELVNGLLSWAGEARQSEVTLSCGD